MKKNNKFTWVGEIPDIHTRMPGVEETEEEVKQRLVVKSNKMIQNSIYDLSLQEQKVILYCISKIMPQDTTFNTVKVDIKSLCKYCGIEMNGKNYQNFRKSIQDLRNKSFWLKSHDGKYETLCSWVNKAKINIGETVAEIRLDEDMMPYLLQLRESFTIYELQNVLSMRSKYSVALYEILKSYSNIGGWEVGVEELKAILKTAEYKEFNNFKVKVLNKAVGEINKFTDIRIGYHLIRENRKITRIFFRIYTLKEYNESKKSIEENEK